jgi:hypothetical protein
VKDRAEAMKEIKPEIYSKALGIKWDVIKDAFYYAYNSCVHDESITKRSMLSQLSSLYDPLGLVTPIIMNGKMIFQDATLLKLTWDERVPTELCARWSQWMKSLEEIRDLQFPRCLIPPEFTESVVELHHFSDASERGYGACSYVRIVSPYGKIHTLLIASKGRLAPVKRTTVPRLELSAAVLAATLNCVIVRELDVPILNSYFWTDSKIALAYIKNNTKQFKPFVAYRVSRIREHCKPNQWHHMKGDDNPADILSRGCTVHQLDEKWLQGAKFLSDYKNAWPVQSEMPFQLEDDPEMKKDIRKTPVVLASTVDKTNYPLEQIIQHYSSYYRLKKAICWILRFKEFLLRRHNKTDKSIDMEELKRAEIALVKYVQHIMFPDEIHSLRKEQLVRRNSPLRKFSPVLHDGLLVVGGRMAHAAVPYSAKHPMILPHSHRLSQMIIDECHNAAHLGTEWTR